MARYTADNYADQNMDYVWPSRWTCMCGRSFSTARMCLKCEDRLPWWIIEQRISWTERGNMTTTQYKKWVERAEAEDAADVIRAATEIHGWLQDA